jgi:hypothetical protein
VLLRQSHDLHNQRQLLVLALTREYREARVELHQDTTETPHIDRSSVWDSQYNLRRSVEPRLNVRVYALVREARRAKVDYFDSRLVRGLEQNVLGLQITVNDIFVAEILQRLQDLDGEATDERQ